MAKYLLYALLLLPFGELAAFIVVSLAIGFVGALGLIIAGSFLGAIILRHAGGNHIGRMRVVLADGSFTRLEADGTGTLTLVAGFLLLIPGFITDVLALLLLVAPLRRAALHLLRRQRPPEGVVDLEPDHWHHVPDPRLPPREPPRPR